MKYKYLEHTADAKFRAYGKSLEEAFENAALAMFNILFDPAKVKAEMEEEISIRSKNKESLLYDFLEELLFIMDTRGFLLNKISDLRIERDGESYFLSCTVYGDSYENYDMRGNIKSITYNEMLIEEKDGVMLQVVVDI